jgi:2-polyprenyl-3-methyl-5-hydroxy-6-metoxy-1,4-benzoquinol methylase
VSRAYPHAEVIGYDSDPASVAEARQNAAAHGVEARFEVREARSLQREGPFDLALILEALHDMSQPVDALESIRLALTPGGAVLVADEKVADRFQAPGDDVERLMYGWSVVHCLPAAMHDQPSAAIGTVIRPNVVRQIAAQAGFSRTEVLPVDAGFFRVYRLG